VITIEFGTSPTETLILEITGATLLPFGGSAYDSPDHQNAWKTVNDWIRNSGRFDAVIDLDSAMRDPANPTKLLPDADTGDHLHPNETGHRMMAEAVDLTFFAGILSSAVGENSKNLPNTFSLLQNYPNPFNPTTKIKFSIPTRSLVTLTIYDILGREMSTLLNEEKTAGTYEVDFNGNLLASGVYYYSIIAEKFNDTKKLILLK